jgi:hypothetical protein
MKLENQNKRSFFNMPLYIFISHASEDHDFVLPLAERMKKDLGDIAEIFVDDWEIKVGDSIVAKINEAAKKADFFIVVLSKVSVKKEWVQREIDTALIRQLSGMGTRILPIWLEISKDDVPPLLQSIKAAVFRHRFILDEEEYKKLLEPILDHEKAKFYLEFQGQVVSNIRHLDTALTNQEPSLEEINFIIDLIKKYDYCENYFFSKLDSLKWFYPLKHENFFSPQKAPKPKQIEDDLYWEIPHWYALDYLERVSEKVSIPGNEKYADELLIIIKDVTKYHERTKELDNPQIWLSFVKILSNLPSEKITIDVIDLIPIWFDSKFSIATSLIILVLDLLHKKLLTDNPEDAKKVEHLLWQLTDLKLLKEVKAVNEIITYLVEYLIPLLNPIVQRCSLESVSIFTERIKNLLSSKYDGTLNSFYDYEKASYLLYEPVEFLSFILSKILIVKSITDLESTKKILESFFDEEHPIFTKIALFIIGEQFEKFKDLFWDIFKEKGEKILLGSSVFWGDELKKVLEKLPPLTDPQRNLIKAKITILMLAVFLAELTKGKDTKKSLRKSSLFIQKIYKALSNDPVFKTEYESMKKITEVDAELGPAIGLIQPVIETSPLAKEKILDMPNEELADFLVKFKTESFFGGPTVEELARTLSIAVKTNPQKFIQNLTPFLKVGYLYASKLLDGLTYALKENIIDYKPVFTFVENYINREGFWKNELKVETAVLGESYGYFISNFCDFIVEKFNTREEETFFDDTERLLNLILQHLKSEKPSAETNNYVFYSFNSPLGKVLETYIKLVSKSPASKKSSLKENFLKKYKQLLDDNIIEAYTFFGFYISFFYKEDKEFTLDFISRINTATDEWEAFMTGYFYNTYFYKDLYNLMKNHYKASLTYNFKDISIKKSFIQHLSLAYLLNLENLTTSDLFYKLVHNLDPIVISEIIYFFYYFFFDREISYKAEEVSQIKNRILNFWTFVYDTLKSKPKETLTESEKKILSRSTNLSIYLTRPEEPYISYLKYTAEFLEEPDFVTLSDTLDAWLHSENNLATAKLIAEILAKAPVFRYIPKDKKDKILFFIKYFYETGDREVVELADSICNKYIKNGAFFVKEICEKFHRTP